MVRKFTENKFVVNTILFLAVVNVDNTSLTLLCSAIYRVSNPIQQPGQNSLRPTMPTGASLPLRRLNACAML